MRLMKKGKKIPLQLEHLIGLLSFFFNRKALFYGSLQLILIGTSCLLIGLGWDLFDKENGFRVGFPATRTYLAVKSARFVDEAATKRLREATASRVSEVLILDETSIQEIPRRLEALQIPNGWKTLPPLLVDLLERLPEKNRQTLLKEALFIGQAVFLGQSSLVDPTSLIWQKLERTQLSRSEKNIVYQILDSVVQASLSRDEKMKQKLKSELVNQIQPVEREVHPGAVLLEKGQIVTQSLAKLLQEQGYPESSFPTTWMFFVAVVVLIWGLWIVWIEKKQSLHFTERDWVFLATLLAFTWAIMLFLSKMGVDGIPIVLLAGWLFLTEPQEFSHEMVWGGGIIGALIASDGSSSFLTQNILLAGVAATAGYVLFKDLKSRLVISRRLFELGAVVSLLAIFIRWGLGMTATPWLFFLYLLFSALWSSIVIALLPLWEMLFDVLSPMRLVELSHPSHPLLKRLQLEAPGTYHHTIMVGTLAEAAANRLGMNGILVKAGAYYHDIGKLKRPHFFVENQLQGENIHDGLTPTLSALVIIAHVRDGIAIANEYKLPRVLKNFIEEHHGTTCLAYFYKKALSLGEQVSIEQFSYPGPRPRSKETALVMLADSVEAAVKSSEDVLNVVKLREIVEEVVESKIMSKQLEDVDFTLRDLAVIKEAFIDVLKSVYHTRRIKKIETSQKPVQIPSRKEKEDS